MCSTLVKGLASFNSCFANSEVAEQFLTFFPGALGLSVLNLAWHDLGRAERNSLWLRNESLGIAFEFTRDSSNTLVVADYSRTLH